MNHMMTHETQLVPVLGNSMRMQATLPSTLGIWYSNCDLEVAQLGDTRNPTRLQNFFSSKSELFRGRIMGKRAQPCSKTANRAEYAQSGLSIIFALPHGVYAGNRLETFLGTTQISKTLSHTSCHAASSTPSSNAKEVTDTVSIFTTTPPPSKTRPSSSHNHADRAAS